MVTRILQILKEENLTASQFADIIDVQRSSMSHILSGRNNPSLDFVHKILKAFPNVNTDWLMFGTGVMYKNLNTPQTSSTANSIVNANSPSVSPIKPSNNPEMFDLFGDFTPQPIVVEPINNIVPNEVAAEFNQNIVHSEDAVPYGIKNKESESYTQKQPDITHLESNISAPTQGLPNISNSREVIKKDSLEDKEIDRIVIFYTDQTFSMYKPEK